MNLEQLSALKIVCNDIMRCDQYRLRQRVQKIENKLKTGKTIQTTVFEQLMKEIQTSFQQQQRRVNNLPMPVFSDDLPVSERREEIIQKICEHQVIVITGETGSGKTTQLPKICLAAGRGINGLIGCTQPRRIAARTIANRVASELNTQLGHAVGYKVRFSDHVSSESYIKFMTDGILLAETQSDRFLENYDTIIIDEAHERSLNIDFLLGYLKQLLPKRPDLKIIVTSATIDTLRFAEHFNDAPIVEVSGRTYPVEVFYHPLTSENDNQDKQLQEAIIDAVDEIFIYDKQADILIFLPGEREIRETTEALRKHRLFNTEILPLYARLSVSEQNKVFAPANERRIVLATNVAETSLTVPRIKAVIDSGLARISRYSIRNKVQRLPIEAIARSSADQRKGRCGRIAPGICLRLFSEQDYNNRAEYTEPEILRTSLASVILQMLSLKLGDISQFPFVDPPTPKMINAGFTLLAELGAVGDNRNLTEIGRQLAKLPIDPRIGRMILGAKQENCLNEVLIIASALSIQDPRERPLDAQQAADTAQRQFSDENSDFLSFVKLWNFYQQNVHHLSNNKLKKLCQEHFVSYMRMREWVDIHHQLTNLIKEMGWKLNQVEAKFEEIHCALLAGLLGNIGFKTKEEHYLGARNIKLFLFPGSGLFKKQPKWMIASELVETSKLYARCIAKIEPEWIEKVAGDLCQHQYFEPHWEKTTAQVAGYEKVTLYGLGIILKRRINYGPLDPILAREIFIRHALVYGEYHTKAAFFHHNRELFNEIEVLEHKARKQNILVDDDQVFEFYNRLIPEGIYNGKAFETWLKQAETDNPKLLFLQREDLMQAEGDRVTVNDFPDYMLINGVKLPLSYHFEPNHERDGVTIEVPVTLLNQLPPEPFEWLVPGLLKEKVIALLRALPKSIRRHFVPVPDVAEDILTELSVPKVVFGENGNFLEMQLQSLHELLTTYCHKRLDQSIKNDIWQLDNLPTHLTMNFLLIDHNDQFLVMGRDLSQLQQQWGDKASDICRQEVANESHLEKDYIKTWDFGELPAQVTLKINGVNVQGFPTLVDEEEHVNLRIMDNPELAKQSFHEGLKRLFWLNLPTKKLIKQMPINHKLCLQYTKIGNCEQLKQEMLVTIIESVFLFEPLPVNKEGFDQRLSAGKQKLMPMAYEYADQLAQVLKEYHELTQKLGEFNNANPAIPEIKNHLKSLIYVGFVKEVPLDRLKHLPRYLKSVRMRLERLAHDPHKDAKKAKQFQPLWDNYWQYREQHPEITLELVEFRWVLEELRVSLFAQELKTAMPVSIQKVEKLWQDFQ